MSAHLPNLGQGKRSEGPEARQERGVVSDGTMCRRHGGGSRLGPSDQTTGTRQMTANTCRGGDNRIQNEGQQGNGPGTGGIKRKPAPLHPCEGEGRFKGICS